ncbi:MAG: enhanced serine sensitivity protein SseB [Lachnospiraceae bacterium]|nr:enhanced serine sensitivity protein SseB [Lachnospiraceae bacterium]
MDINKPITNPKLLNAIIEMKKDNNKEQFFINELFKAKFLCPARVEMKNSAKGDRGQITVGEGSAISLTSIDDQQGKHFLMAFTDWEEIRKWNKEVNIQTIVLTCEDYQQILTKDDSPYAGFVVNPYGANIMFNKEILENIHSNEMVVQAGNSVMIGEPKDYPKDMAEKLKKTFVNIEDIKSAYLLWMARNSETSYLLVLDANGNEQKLFPVVGEICQSFLKGNFLDMVPFSSGFGQSAVKNQTPFYISSKLG